MAVEKDFQAGIRHAVRMQAGLIDVHVSERRGMVVVLLLFLNLLTDEVTA